MEAKIFEELREIIYRESGINLSEEKKQMLMNRLNKRLRKLGLKEPRQYLDIIETDASGEELLQLIDVVSTNVTYFFRESEHFDYLKSEVFAAYKKQGRDKVRIWCAASSTGEEPYTLAMLGSESFSGVRADVKVLATDISTRVLNHAVRGLYQPKQFEKMPQDVVEKYFSAYQDEDETFWKVDPAIASMVTFKRLNLSQFPYPLKGPLDVIFCRNVMIYFDLQLRTKIIAEMTRLLAPGGYLFLGRSENLLGIHHDLKGCGASVFRKPK